MAKYTAEQMIQALRETKGQITLAARRVGCAYNTMRRYVDEYPSVKAVLEEENAVMGDAVELALYDEAVNKRNTAALIFLAKTKFKERGYTERHDIGLALSPEVQAMAQQLGINKADIVREFEALIRAEAERVNSS